MGKLHKTILTLKTSASSIDWIVVCLIVLVAAAAGYFFFGPSIANRGGTLTPGTPTTVGANQAVLMEVDSLALKNSKIFDTLRLADCTRTNKFGGYWTIDGCDDPNIYFRIDLPSEGYYISYCAKASSQTERFTTLSKYLERDCAQSADESLIKDLGETHIYSACGYRLTVRGECILGIGGLA
jgi:hypothetical protein